MFVAGDHAKNDIAGEWKEMLEKEGFTVSAQLEGLGQIPEIRAFLEKVYNVTGKKEDIASLTDDEVIAMVNRIKHGIPFATPVFDGASEEQIKQMLEMAFPDSEVKRLQLTPNREQATLYDGRTGDAFTCPVTVEIGRAHV